MCKCAYVHLPTISISCVRTTPSCRSCLRSVIGFRPGFLFSWEFTQEIYAASCCCNPSITNTQIHQSMEEHINKHTAYGSDQIGVKPWHNWAELSEFLCLLCWGGRERETGSVYCPHFSLFFFFNFTFTVKDIELFRVQYGVTSLSVWHCSRYSTFTGPVWSRDSPSSGLHYKELTPFSAQQRTFHLTLTLT